MTHLLKLMLLGVLALSQVVMAQQVGSLDLTVGNAKHRLREPNGGGGSSCGAADHTYYPEASVSLMSLDRTQYAFGDDIIFEVKIQNVGREPITIPWSQNLADFEPTDPSLPYSYRSGTISLRFGDDAREFLDFAGFYGVVEKPETLKELNPGEWVLIRGRTQLQAYVDWVWKELKTSGVIETQVRAGLMLDKITFQPKGKSGPVEDSHCINIFVHPANQLAVTLLPRPSSH